MITAGTEIIAVIGVGTMGTGIAQVASCAGHDVIFFDPDPVALDRAVQTIRSGLRRRLDRGLMTETERIAVLSRLQPIQSLDGAARAHIVIEAIPENLEAKHELFRKLERICAPETVFASNTSSLSITKLASVLGDPARFVGFHFFYPAPDTMLVEVVSGRATSEETARRMGYLAGTWGKHYVRTRSTPGFIVNRVARPFCAEALRLLEEQVVKPATLDAIMRESGGFKMGPLELMDLIGHDDNYAVANSVFGAHFQDPRFKPSLVQKELIDAGRLGRKSGRGFYEYSQDAVRPMPEQLDPQPAPDRVAIGGGLGVASSLKTLFIEAGITVEQIDGDGRIEFDGITLAMTDGRTAAERASNENQDRLVLFDLALDYTTSERVAITTADHCGQVPLQRAAGLFQAIGKSVSAIEDAPGMIVTRTVCMLANEGADAVNQGVCNVKAVDLAMRYGAGYPMGPLVWADRIGLAYVVKTLENIQRSYGEDRYRISQLLRRKGLIGRDFYH